MPRAKTRADHENDIRRMIATCTDVTHVNALMSSTDTILKLGKLTKGQQRGIAICALNRRNEIERQQHERRKAAGAVGSSEKI